MKRVIRFFNKKDELYAGETELHDMPLLTLQKAFSVSEDNPMYDCFPIGEEHLKLLTKHVNSDFDFDLNKYDYFLDFDS